MTLEGFVGRANKGSSDAVRCAAEKAVLEFLKNRLLDQQPFSRSELKAQTNWSEAAFKTYWSKQFKRFMVELPDGRYRVAESFLPYITWPKFREHVTQMRNAGVTAYRRHEYSLMRVFEFYMPLTHEHALKATLDALFYTDIIKPKLRAIGVGELGTQIPRNAGEADDE